MPKVEVVVDLGHGNTQKTYVEGDLYQVMRETGVLQVTQGSRTVMCVAAGRWLYVRTVGNS